MTSQAQPTTSGVYRVKVFGTDKDCYWKYISDATRWISMTTLDASSDQFKWNIAPIAGVADTFTIKPVSDPSITLGTSTNNSQKYWGYGLPVGTTDGSARWKIAKRSPNSLFSKIYFDGSPNVVDCQDTTANKAVHFFQDLGTSVRNQCWVFERLGDSVSPVSPQPVTPVAPTKPLNPYKYLERRAIIPAPAPTLRTGPGGPVSASPDRNNLQGDVYYMFPKRFERFIFFIISDVTQFRKDLDTYLPRVTSAQQTIDNIQTIHDNPGGGLDLVSTQIALSRAGLKALKVNSRLGDEHFDQGSLKDEKSILGDMAEYDAVFKNGTVHCVILLTAAKKETVESESVNIRNIFGRSVRDNDITTMDGRVREGDGEFFGWRDGISQPGCEGMSIPQPGQRVVKPGVIVMGYPGDPVYDNPDRVPRPDFTKDGSFMVFRKLEQDVYLFEDYINTNYVSISPDEPQDGRSLTVAERKALFGARMVGRFKKGAPLALTPYRDNSDFRDPAKINNFDYTTGNRARDLPNCPFAAHIRKTAPRNLDPLVQKEYLDAAVIIRTGIPYGPETNQAEREAWRKLTPQEKLAPSPRGLLFVCYQASIENGFFLQTTGFANNDFFPTTSILPVKHGQDPIIGGPKAPTVVDGTADIKGDGEVILALLDKNNKKYEVTGFAKAVDTSLTAFEQNFFVTSRGGEYFFVPSIKTLRSWGATEYRES